MHILLVQVGFHLPTPQSLKDKRALLKPILHHLRTEYNVSVAETGDQDLWQSVELAIVMVSTSTDHLDAIERRILDDLEGKFDVALTVCDRQWL